MKPKTIKGIPHSVEAEAYVLGSILIEPNLAVEFCGNLSADDFYTPINKLIYGAIEYLYRQKKEVTMISVIEILKAMDKYKEVGEEYLVDLIDAVPNTITTEAYVNVLKEKALERELYYEAQNISQKVLEGEDELSELLRVSEKNISDIVNKQRTGDLKLISTCSEKVFEIIQNNTVRANGGQVIGLDTGYEKLNEFTFGFQPGELIILAARPGVGKSAFALNIAYKMAKNFKKNVAFFSLEMGIDQLVMRMISIASNVKLSNIRSGNLTSEETTKTLNARMEMDDLPFYIDETTTNSMEDIKIKCRKLNRSGKLDFIIIDYLQLLSATSGKQKLNRYEEVSSLSRSLKLLARELDVPILALSQLSRNVDSRAANEKADNPQGKKQTKPILSDLRESGSIEQDADIVLFLHRDSVNEDPSKRATNLKVECIVAKNRQGMTGSLFLVFRGDYTSFEPASEKKNSDLE